MSPLYYGGRIATGVHYLLKILAILVIKREYRDIRSIPNRIHFNNAIANCAKFYWEELSLNLE